jgi:Zn-dependent protease with chaperone function
MRVLLVLVEGQIWLAGVLGIFAAEVAFLFWGLWSRRPVIGLVAVFVAVPLLRSTASAIRACFFRVGPPDGLPLARSHGRALYDLVDEIRQTVTSPAIDGITITGRFMASAALHSRAWRLRRHRTLVLGLPVLCTLSMPELRAVIAHELAHFSSAQDRFAAWVYRTRQSWLAVRAALDQRLATPVYVYWLLRWYVPRLNAAAGEVSRRHELAADRAAARVAGARAAVDALIVSESGARFADDVLWPAIRMSHERGTEPPRPYSQMLNWHARVVSTETLDELLTPGTKPDDTHPSLRERCDRLGEPARIPPPARLSGGKALLGEELERLATRLDQEWLTRHGDAWQQRRAEYVEQTAALESLAPVETATPDELFRRAALVEALEGSLAALPFYQRAAGGGHPAASLAAGRVLLARGDSQGIALVEESMDRDDSLVPQGCRILAAYYAETRQELEARRCDRRAVRHTTLARLAKPSLR